MTLLPLAFVLAQGVPLGSPVPSFDVFRWEEREPLSQEVLLVEMGWISEPMGAAQFKPDAGMLLLLHGAGDGQDKAPPNLGLVLDWFHTEMDRGLAVASVVLNRGNPDAASQWQAMSGVRHPVATVPDLSIWKDSAVLGMLTLVSRGGILIWRGLDPEEAALRLHAAYLWPRVLKPLGPPLPILGEAWARYHDGLWSHSRALVKEAGETPLVGPGILGSAEFKALLDRHEAEMLKLVRALPDEPKLHDLISAARLREPLVRGFPGSTATKEVLLWLAQERKRPGGSQRLRLAADWIALGPHRPAGYPRRDFKGRDPLRSRFQSIVERAKGQPLGKYAAAMLKMQP